MNQELWCKVEALFHAALEREPGARQSFLDSACDGDAELRGKVEILLSQERRAGNFLEVPEMNDMTVTLAAGWEPARQFGPYCIMSPLGAGGQGEVYRAHDSKLARDVAIKILPSAFARNPERLARFRREARTLASLNHPNIAAIYELVEESGEADFLVLELVEGEILRGPLPVDLALDYARQVGEALEAAHDKGIIHRDLKPANVKVTPQGRVKVLDFGLAKAIWGPDGNKDLSQLAGVESIAGHIVGTPPYMSPEQARGRDVDKRTDIWAFGCLLYELLAGKRAFQGETLQDTIAEVLEREPDWQALPANTPAKVRELLRRCLQKDAARRLHDIANANRIIVNAQLGWNRWRVAAVAAAALATLAFGSAFWLRNYIEMPDRAQWVQLTKLPGSVTQPAFSPDGRMLTFIRGKSQFYGAGQIYVKVLPDGVPRQITHDSVAKMSPTFSADGERIAYTTVNNYEWDTWAVPTSGGEPQLWLRNVSGLTWTGLRQVLFSEIRKAPHMAIVAAGESRLNQRDVYLPVHEHGMAHRSYLSPDRKWALIVEMDHDHAWTPCRLVPLDGNLQGRRVGPPAAACTFAAWSPDGKWMYFSSEAGGAHHIWRQRFPDSPPEQVTSGPTEEEGIAMAPDGKSFVTAVTLSNVSVWIHDASGDRPISLEGNSADPQFTPDGTRLFYRIVKQTPKEFRFLGGEPGEVWVTELKTGRSEPLAPGFQSLDYDISADGKQVVLEAADQDGIPQLWTVSFDRRSPPQQIPNVAGRTPRFGPSGEIFFRSSGYAYRVRPDGTGLRKAIEHPIALLVDVSPDAYHLLAWATTPTGGMAIQAFPLDGGPSVYIAGGLGGWHFSPDGRFISIWGGPVGQDRSFIIPVPVRRALPRIPALGFRTEQDLASLPGAYRIDAEGVVPSASPNVYAFYRGTTQRNLYRIPIR